MTLNAALQHLVDDLANGILFGSDDVVIELPAQALHSLVIDVMCATAITDPLVVERRLLGEFHSRLDRRLRAAVDDTTGARWRVLMAGLTACFPTRH